MRGKSILALAVALAMIFSVIPAFGLTASAAERGDIIVDNGVKYEIVSDNLVKDGTFETDRSEWTSYSSWNGSKVALDSSIAASSEQGHDSANSLKVVNSAGGTTASGNFLAQFMLNEGAPVTEDKTYIVSFWRYGGSGLTITVGASSNADGVTVDWTEGEQYGNSGAENSNPSGLPENTWHQMSKIIKAKANETVCVEVYPRWCGGQYFDDFELYEIEPVQPDATVKVEYKDSEQTVLKTVEFSDLYKTDEFKYTPEAWFANEDYTEFYTPDDASERSITLSTGENTITIDCTKVEFASVELPTGTVSVNDAQYTVVGKTNLVPNPSFETAEAYSIVGWYGGQGGASNTNAYPAAHQFESTDAKAGTYSFGSRYGDDWNGLCSILTNFKVEQNKLYYFSYDVKYAKGDTPNPNATVTLGISEGPHGAAVANDQKSEEKINNVGNEWVTKTRVIKVGSDIENPYIQFNAYRIGNSNNAGEDAKFLFDNFKLVEVEEDVQNVTVNYKYQDQVIKSEQVELNASVKTYTGKKAGTVMAGEDGGLYKVVSGDPVEIADGSANIALDKLTNVITLKEGALLTDKLTDDETYKGDTNFGMFNWHDNYDRVGVAVLDVDKAVTQPALSATRIRFNQNARGNEPHNGAIKAQIYAVSLEDFAAADLSDMANVAAFFTPENLAVEIVDDDRNFFGAESQSPEEFLMALDAEKVKAAAGESGKVVLLGNAQRTLYAYAGEGMAIVEGAAVALDGRLMKTVLPNAENVEINVGAAIAAKDDDGNIYAAADGKITIAKVEKNMNLTSVAELGVKILDGAQVRIGGSSEGNIAADSGLRFIGTVEPESLAASADSIKVVITAENDSEEKEVEITIDKYQDEPTNSVFTAVLTNLKKENYNRVFTATPVAVFGDVEIEGAPVSRSIYEVAEGLLTMDGTEDSVTGKPYEVEEAIAKVLNKYVNTVGVRIDLTVDGAATVDNDGYKGHEGNAEAFFTIESGEKDTPEGTTYTIVVKPIGGKVDIDENLLAENIRINNNNSVAKKGVTNVQKAEDGTVTITFDSAKAVKD